MTSASRAYEALARSCADAVMWLEGLALRGTDLRVGAHYKAVHEAEEFAADPTPEEAADVLICLVGALNYQGHGINDLARAVAAKVAVNERRTWVLQEDGTYQHAPSASGEGRS